jgi:hypothetical protein
VATQLPDSIQGAFNVATDSSATPYLVTIQPSWRSADADPKAGRTNPQAQPASGTVNNEFVAVSNNADSGKLVVRVDPVLQNILHLPPFL